MQINSTTNQPNFNATIKAKNVNVYDAKSRRWVGNIGNFVIDTKKVGSVINKIDSMNPYFTKGISTFLVTNTKNPLIFGIPSENSFKYNKTLLDEAAKAEHRFDTYIMK